MRPVSQAISVRIQGPRPRLGQIARAGPAIAEIGFGADGFTQKLRAEPALLDEQRLSAAERAGRPAARLGLEASLRPRNRPRKANRP